MNPRSIGRTRAGVLPLTAFALALSCSSSGPSAGQERTAGVGVANVTKHANLGFTAEVPFSVHPSGNVLGLLHWDVAFSGTARFLTDFATDVALSYDSADLVGGGSLPFQLTYTPTPGASLAAIDVDGIATINFTGCANCPATIVTQIESGTMSFTAPLGPPDITVAGSSNPITLAVGPLPILNISVATGLTLEPAASTGVPGLGGAAASVGVSGATLTSFPLVEWDAAGQTLNGTMQLPATLEGGFSVALSPLVHWVGTSGSADLVIHWTPQFKSAVETILDILSLGICLIADCSIGDPAPISIFSGELGPVYQSVGLDTTIGDAVGGIAGPLIADRVADGFVPVPLFSPELPTISLTPPLPTLGALVFGSPGVAITGAPTEAVLVGSSITLGSNVSGGTPPLVYHWLKNGAAFASTATITDTPAVGTTTYALYVTDADGAISNTASVVVHGYDFSMALAPSSQTIPFGASTTYTLSLVLTGGSGLPGVPATVATALAGLPAGASTVGFPASLPLSTTASSATFTVNTLQATPVGTHTLTATGTTGTGSRTASADLVIITPQQATQNLLDTIAGMGLPHGTATSLAASLGTLIAHIDAGNAAASCGKLGAFVNKVNADLGNGRLTPAQAAQLLLLASQIQASLGC